MQNLNDVKREMSDLFARVKSGECDVKTASELANITGKFLKAEQLLFAREVFTSNTKLIELPNDNA